MLVHKEAADVQESHAAAERRLGNDARAARMEARADAARERAQQQAAYADVERRHVDALLEQLKSEGV